MLILYLCLDATVLMRFVYPMTFDLFYIPIVSTFLRLGTCVSGYEHVALPGGATCDCIDRIGVFWVVGFIGFIVTYRSALHYKMNIEPHGETMDFRFQPGFQFLMVMARTRTHAIHASRQAKQMISSYVVYPMITVLVNNQDTTRGGGIALTTFLLGVSTFLLVYSHKTQPCIGSGRIPNNLRVLTFSSAIYTAFCVLVELIAHGSINKLYYALLPLPVVWLGAWKLNDRRALLYHVPGVSIPQLLEHPSTDVNLVGAIAALHLNPNNIHECNFEPILRHLNRLAATATAPPLCRAYALRTLWFGHIENFLKASVAAVGEPDDSEVIQLGLWLKDRANLDRGRLSIARSTPSFGPRTMHAIHGSKKRTKLACVTITPAGPSSDLLPPFTSTAGDMTTLTTKSQRIRPRHTFGPRGIAPLVPSTLYHVIMIGYTSWISYKEPPQEAVTQLERLASLAFDALVHSVALRDSAAIYDIGTFLLQWYRTGYLRLNKSRYLQLLTALCSADQPKIVIDAVHTLHTLTTDGVFTMELWLERSLVLNGPIAALSHASRSTVLKAASLAASVAAKAAGGTKTLGTLLSPAAATNLHCAFTHWRAAYDVSHALENVYQNLYQIQLRQLQLPPPPSKSTRLLWAVNHAKAKFQRHIGRVEPAPSSTRVASMKTRLSLLLLKGAKRNTADSSPRPEPPPKTMSFHHLVRAVRAKPRPPTVYVPSDVLAEIERRQSLRRQFVLKLELAFAMQKAPHSSEGEVAEAVMNALKLVHFADEGAIRDFAKSALEPALQVFVSPFVQKFETLHPTRRHTVKGFWRT
ncbi:hypothetical protein ACHHYP_06016 [Achlya hypogyna]|uniref:Uncharacterized protein n=1 Tax=Achlya hypogyna TaxID=1202772 RepID=A0A1V9ZND3_ACHHY|nr:hypothetical protein ACHHYP_06016 [Achlya hypogyna]